MEAYNSGARLTRKEQEMFRFFVRTLDFSNCYRILKAAKERFELQENTQKNEK
jgi:hypothetical protein